MHALVTLQRSHLSTHKTRVRDCVSRGPTCSRTIKQHNLCSDAAFPLQFSHAQLPLDGTTSRSLPAGSFRQRGAMVGGKKRGVRVGESGHRGDGAWEETGVNQGSLKWIFIARGKAAATEWLVHFSNFSHRNRLNLCFLVSETKMIKNNKDSNYLHHYIYVLVFSTVQFLWNKTLTVKNIRKGLLKMETRYQLKRDYYHPNHILLEQTRSDRVMWSHCLLCLTW